MAEDSHVEFIDSKEGNQFTVRISRPLTATEAGSTPEIVEDATPIFTAKLCAVTRLSEEINM